MGEVFTISNGDASVIQQHYERIIEALLRNLLDIEKTKNENHNSTEQGANKNNSTNSQELKIFDGEQLKGWFSLSPQLIEQLQQIRSTPVGEIVEGAVRKRVELDGQVVLQTDEHGRVTVNNFLQPNIVQSTSPQLVNQVWNGGVQTNNNSTTINGTTRVMSSLQSIEDSPLKTLLENTCQQLQTEIKNLQQERNLYQQLIETRLQDPQNTSWWQQVIKEVSIVTSSINAALKMAVQEFKEHSAKHKDVASLQTLSHHQRASKATEFQISEYKNPPSGSYNENLNLKTDQLIIQSDSGYQISRNGSYYQVLDLKTGNEAQVIFTDSGINLVSGKISIPKIQEVSNLLSYYQDRESYYKDKESGSFVCLREQGIEDLNRVQEIAKALVKYARNFKKEVEIDGQSYNWQATPDGRVKIFAKDGRGTLLSSSEGKLVSSMTEKDLKYFETAIPQLQPKENVTTFSSRKLENSELER